MLDGDGDAPSGFTRIGWIWQNFSNTVFDHDLENRFVTLQIIDQLYLLK
jgi:hypothetical protein